MKRDDFERLKDNYEIVPYYEEIEIDTITPIGLAVLLRDEENLFLLESATLKKALSRFTYIGIPKVRLEDPTKDPFEKLIGVDKTAPKINEIGDFSGGIVFLLGYGASNYTGLLRKPIREGKDLFVGFPVKEFIAIDNYKQKMYAVLVETQYEEAKEKVKELKQKLFSKLKEQVRKGEPPLIEEIKWEMTKKEFMQTVEYVKEQIEKGEAIQVVLSQKVEVYGKIDPLDFYRVLRKINPSPYMFFIKAGNTFYIGSSPEVHLKVTGNTALMRPIAGTYPIGENLEEVIEKLKQDEKEQAEHLMLVDLARNDLYTHCLPNSVKVPKYMYPEVYSHVVHLVSTVIGKIEDKTHPVELLRKTFPAGTVSGAPKVRAMEIIDEVEKSPRDFYAGCVGYVSFNGNLDTAITIRSARFTNGILTLRAGAGIVYDSKPEREHQEVKNKLEALLSSIEKIKANGGI